MLAGTMHVFLLLKIFIIGVLSFASISVTARTPESQVHGGQSGTGPQLAPRRRYLTEVRGGKKLSPSQESENVSFSILPAPPSPTTMSVSNSTGTYRTASSALRTATRTTIIPVAPTAVTTNDPSAIPTKPPKDPTMWTFKIDIGNQRQHVGSWYDAYIRDEIKAALKERCRQGKKQWGENTCSTEHWGFWIESSSKFHIIESIENNVYISITNDNIPGDYGEDLRQAFIEQIADTFMIAVDDDKNCYKWDRKTEICLFCNDKMCASKDSRARVIRWCNAPDFVCVAIVDQDGNEKAHMKVELKFQGLADQGKFDCRAIIDAVDKDARDNRQQTLKDATNGQNFTTVVACSSDEVTGSCSNSDCLYQEGSWSKKKGSA